MRIYKWIAVWVRIHKTKGDKLYAHDSFADVLVNHIKRG